MWCRSQKIILKNKFDFKKKEVLHLRPAFQKRLEKWSFDKLKSWSEIKSTELLTMLDFTKSEVVDLPPQSKEVGRESENKFFDLMQQRTGKLF